MKTRILFIFLHTALLIYVTGSLLNTSDPVWPMMWLFMGIVDFPVFFLSGVISWFLKLLEFNTVYFLSDRLADVHNFWVPFLSFSIFGTLMWYWIAGKLSKLDGFVTNRWN